MFFVIGSKKGILWVFTREDNPTYFKQIDSLFHYCLNWSGKVFSLLNKLKL